MTKLTVGDLQKTLGELDPDMKVTMSLFEDSHGRDTGVYQVMETLTDTGFNVSVETLTDMKGNEEETLNFSLNSDRSIEEHYRSSWGVFGTPEAIEEEFLSGFGYSDLEKTKEGVMFNADRFESKEKQNEMKKALESKVKDLKKQLADESAVEKLTALLEELKKTEQELSNL